MRINKQMIIYVVEIVLLVALALSVIWTIVVYIRYFGYTPELGIYDTRVFSWNVGEYLKYGEEAIHYEYTNLNLIEVLSRIW